MPPVDPQGVPAELINEKRAEVMATEERGNRMKEASLNK